MASEAARRVKRTEVAKLSDGREVEVELPLTVSEFADLHSVSRSAVRKWLNQARLPFERRGGGNTRAAAVLIWTANRPDMLAPGSLSEGQRTAWPKGRR